MRALCITLIAAGMAVSAYLLFRHLALVSSPEALDAGVCSTVFGADCDRTLTSSLAHVLGIPLAGWGVVYLGTLAALLGVGWTLGGRQSDDATLVAAGLALCGALGSLGLAATFALGIVPVCPLCLVVHAIDLVLAVLLWRLAGASFPALGATFARAGRYLLGGEVEDAAAARRTFLGYAAAGLAGVALYQWIFVQTVLHPPAEEPPFDPVIGLAVLGMTPQVDVECTTADPRVGPDDAPVRLVVFGDFECPGCRRVADEVPGLRATYGDALQVVFKHFPLGTACNPAAGRDLHPHACEAALLAESAHRLGRFWECHDALFDADLAKESIESIARRLDVDIDGLVAESRNPDVIAKLREDVQQGIELKIRETPAVYLNGRRLVDTRPAALRYLIAVQIARELAPVPETPTSR